MPVEPGNNLIADWNATDSGNNPGGTETRRDGDDQIRGVKGTIKRNFPNLTNSGTVNASETELNILVGIETTEKVVTLPVGAIMYFEAPTTPGSGWVKKTDAAYNDVALRVVTGTPGTGGTLDFSTVFARTATDGHAITIPQMPSHKHGGGDHGHNGRATGGVAGPDSIDSSNTVGTIKGVGIQNSGEVINLEGDGLEHTHGNDIRVKYRDVYAAEFQGY